MMKNNNLEQTILKTLRAGLSNIEELTEEMKNNETEEEYNFRRRIDFNPNKVMKECNYE